MAKLFYITTIVLALNTSLSLAQPMNSFGGTVTEEEVSGLIPLFHIGSEHQIALDAREISPSLRHVFEQHEITLSGDATVLVPTPGSQWCIKDRPQAYVIRRQVTGLAVYTPTRDIAVADFTNVTRTPELDSYTRAVPTLILSHLARSRKLSFVQRTEIERILEEIGLGESGVVNPQTAARVGQAIGARYMLIGQFNAFQGKDETRIQITIQLVEVESIRVITAEYIQSHLDELDQKAIDIAQRVLEQFFPPSPWTASAQSLVFPGWGQATIHSKSRYAFLPLGIAGITALGLTQYRYMEAERDYQNLIDDPFKTFDDLAASADSRNARNDERKKVLGIVAAVWIANVVDAFIEAQIRHSNKLDVTEQPICLNTQLTPPRIQLTWQVRF